MTRTSPKVDFDAFHIGNIRAGLLFHQWNPLCFLTRPSIELVVCKPLNTHRMSIQAVIFDLDGVIVSTDELHYQAWKQLADREGIAFDRDINNRLRGVSRMESLEIVLEKASKSYSEDEKRELATFKNDFYRQSLNQLTREDILPGVLSLCEALRRSGIRLAIGSSSRNSPDILRYLGLGDYFDATADGNDIQRSKPDPEVFLLAAERLSLAPTDCVVVEDAESGVAAAIAGGFKCVAVGAAASDERAHLQAVNMSAVTAAEILSL